MDFSVVPTYVLAVLLICIVPGPDMAFMAAAGADGGRRAALRAGLGVGLGVTVYAVAVAVGLGALVEGSPNILRALNILAGVYLFYLSWDTARTSDEVSTSDEQATKRAFRRGFFVNLTNPKMMLFFLAFLPRFAGDADNAFLQFMLLGAIYLAIGLAVDLSVGMLTGSARDSLLSSRRSRRMLSLISALVFFVLGVTVVIEFVRDLST